MSVPRIEEGTSGVSIEEMSIAEYDAVDNRKGGRIQEETLLLTQGDRDRLKVLHVVRKGHITQRQAAWQLKLTDLRGGRLFSRSRELRFNRRLDGGPILSGDLVIGS